MKLIRAEVEPGFIAVDNDAEDADLSCRALGLLTRWLRTRPGEEIPPIPDMVKRRKSRGCKRIEGRAALYSASHELEREGFLVRRLEPTEGGSYEWTAYVYPTPLPESERSNPDDRSRRSARVPKNRNPEDRKPEDRKPKTGNPSSYSKLSSNSLSEAEGVDEASRGPVAQREEERESSPAGHNDTRQVPEQRQEQEQRAGQDSDQVPEEPAGDEQQLAVAVAFVAALPGRLGRKSVQRIAPLVVAAFGEGWTEEALRAELARRVDVSRILNAGAVPSLYVRALEDLPAPSAARPAAPAGPPQCPRHPGYLEGDCSPCRAAERDRAKRGPSEPAAINGAALLARFRDQQPA